jgi:hypothetical protein
MDIFEQVIGHGSQVVLNRSHDIKPLCELSNGQFDSFKQRSRSAAVEASSI